MEMPRKIGNNLGTSDSDRDYKAEFLAYLENSEQDERSLENMLVYLPEYVEFSIEHVPLSQNERFQLPNHLVLKRLYEIERGNRDPIETIRIFYSISVTLREVHQTEVFRSIQTKLKNGQKMTMDELCLITKILLGFPKDNESSSVDNPSLCLTLKKDFSVDLKNVLQKLNSQLEKDKQEDTLLFFEIARGITKKPKNNSNNVENNDIIFISHCGMDTKAIIRILITGNESRFLFDYHSNRILNRSSTDLVSEMFSKADKVVVLITNNFFFSDWCVNELRIAVMLYKLSLIDLKVISCLENFEETFARLLEKKITIDFNVQKIDLLSLNYQDLL